MLNKNKLKPVILNKAWPVDGSFLTATPRLILPESEVYPTVRRSRWSEARLAPNEALLTSRPPRERRDVRSDSLRGELLEVSASRSSNSVSRKVSGFPGGRLDSWPGYRVGIAPIAKQYSTDSRVIQKSHGTPVGGGRRAGRREEHKGAAAQEARRPYGPSEPSATAARDESLALDMGSLTKSTGLKTSIELPPLLRTSSAPSSRLRLSVASPPEVHPKGWTSGDFSWSGLRFSGPPAPGRAARLPTATFRSGKDRLRFRIERQRDCRAYSVLGELSTAQKHCLQKFINLCMKDGKKKKSYKIISNTLRIAPSSPAPIVAPSSVLTSAVRHFPLANARSAPNVPEVPLPEVRPTGGAEASPLRPGDLRLRPPYGRSSFVGPPIVGPSGAPVKDRALARLKDRTGAPSGRRRDEGAKEGATPFGGTVNGPNAAVSEIPNNPLPQAPNESLLRRDPKVGPKRRASVSTRSRLILLMKAIENVKPIIEVKKVRISGTTQLVPSIIPKNRQICLAIRWIIEAAILRRNTKKSMTIDQCFFAELIDASQNIGTVRKRRDDLHKLAESNRGFAHYRWWA